MIQLCPADLPFPSKLAEDDFRSKYRLLCQSLRLEGRRLKVLEKKILSFLWPDMR